MKKRGAGEGPRVITPLEVAGWRPALRCGIFFLAVELLCLLLGGGGGSGVSWEAQGHQRDKLRVRIRFKITFGQLDSARNGMEAL